LRDRSSKEGERAACWNLCMETLAKRRRRRKTHTNLPLSSRGSDKRAGDAVDALGEGSRRVARGRGSDQKSTCAEIKMCRNHPVQRAVARPRDCMRLSVQATGTPKT